MSEEESCYSNEEEYFLDVCRSGDLHELKDFLRGLDSEEAPNFDWEWFNNRNDNFMHMLAANNLYEMFDCLAPVLRQKCSPGQVSGIVNKINSLGSCPLHYTVITESKEMAERLLSLGADPNIRNQQGRTAFEEAEKFRKLSIAEFLAPVSINNLEDLKKSVEGMKLNDDSSNSDAEEKLQEIEEKEEVEVEVEEKEEVENQD